MELHRPDDCDWECNHCLSLACQVSHGLVGAPLDYLPGHAPDWPAPLSRWGWSLVTEGLLREITQVFTVESLHPRRHILAAHTTWLNVLLFPEIFQFQKDWLNKSHVILVTLAIWDQNMIRRRLSTELLLLCQLLLPQDKTQIILRVECENDTTQTDPHFFWRHIKWFSGWQSLCSPPMPVAAQDSGLSPLLSSHSLNNTPSVRTSTRGTKLQSLNCWFPTTTVLKGNNRTNSK